LALGEEEKVGAGPCKSRGKSNKLLKFQGGVLWGGLGKVNRGVKKRCREGSRSGQDNAFKMAGEKVKKI